MGYDLFPMETLAFKRRFIREAIDREYLIFFEHDPRVAAGYIRENATGSDTSSRCCKMAGPTRPGPALRRRRRRAGSSS